MKRKIILDTRVTLMATEEGVLLGMPFPPEDREMTEQELFVASCFTIWMGAQENELRSTVLREAILNLASNLISEEKDGKKPS